MTKAKSPLQIPFWNYTRENCGERLNYDFCVRKNGSLCSSPARHETWIVWQDNYIVTTTLTLTGYGNNSNFIFTDPMRHEYSCFPGSAFKIFTHSAFAAGKITAAFTFEKRNTDYGICLAF